MRARKELILTERTLSYRTLTDRTLTDRKRLASNWGIAAICVVVVWVMAGHFMPGGLPFGISLQGLVYGALNAMTAMGLILIYRSTRIINFAQAEIGGLCASFSVIMVSGSHLTYFEAVPIGLVVGLATGALVDLIFMRRLANAPRLIVTVATIGIAQLLGAIELALPSLYGNGGLSSVSNFHFPSAVSFHLGPVLFKSDEIVVMVVVPIMLVALWWFLGRTDVGIAIRGSADAKDRATLLGIPVKKLSMISWIVAAGLSAVGSILTVPIQGANVGSVVGPEALLLPLAAAVIGGMENLSVAFAASLGLGVFEEAIRWSYPQSQTAAVDVGAFVVILVALLVRRRRRQRADEIELGDVYNVREIRPIPVLAKELFEIKLLRYLVPSIVLALVVFLPLIASDSRILLISDMAIYGIIAVSLVVLTGWAGQISLGQFAFVGVGGATTGALLVHDHLNIFLALIIAGIVGALGAMVIGLPALRFPGLYLAAATLAFAVPVNTYLLSSKYFPTLNPSYIPRPLLVKRFDLNHPLDFYYLCLGVLVVAFYLAYNLRRSRAGRAVVAVRDNDKAASAYGISPLRSKLVAFAVSGALAGAAGGLYVVGLQGIQFGGFDPELSIVVFTMVVVGGLGTPLGAVLGAAYVYGIQYWLHGAWVYLASSTGLLLVLMIIPEGIGSQFYKLRDLVVRQIIKRHDIQSIRGKVVSQLDSDLKVSEATHRAAIRLGALEDLELSAPSAHGVGASEIENPLIKCESITGFYGETQVLFDIDCAVAPGEVVALLGTNGAGKSTLLKVMNGLIVPKSGKVIFAGEDITSWTPQQRAKVGLVTVPGGRGVFPSLTVEENLRLAGWLNRHDKKFIEDSIRKALDLFPSLEKRFATRAGLLSGGEQQMLTIGQAMLCKPKLMLIDELSMGLAPAVVGELLRVVRTLADSGVTVMVVEQSVNVATVISKRALFMERGRIRFSGPTPSLAQQPELLKSVFLRAASKARKARSAVSNGAAVGGHDAGGQDVAGPDKLGKGVAGPDKLGQGVAGPDKLGKGVAGPDKLGQGVAGPALDEKFSLEVQNVSKSYGGVIAVSDVSISLKEGEILGVIGSNGAGKTTLFDICSGFVVPDRGKVFIDGRDVTNLGPNWRARNGLGRVFQESRIFPSMTVSEALAVAFETHVDVKDPLASMLRLGAVIDSEKVIKDKCQALLEQLGLGRWHDSYVAELSTGTRRILELGCVMAHDPKVLLLDEPSAGIAQRESEALSELLRGIADQTRASMVIIEHDVPLVSSVADHLVCMHLGEIISRGSTAEVLNDPLVVDAYLGRDEETLVSAGPA